MTTLLPVWVSGLDHNLLLIAVFGAAGSQMLNSIIGAEISGTNYTDKPKKIRGGIVAAIISTLAIFVIILLAYYARSLLHIEAESDDRTMYLIDENIVMRPFGI
jgi:dolichol kinase